MLDWNDLRYFLAVARAGSTLAASKQMRVSQATVSRRISVLEEALGAALFVRGPTGYELSPRGAAVLPAAEAVEQAIGELVGLVDAETRRLTGTVRITTVEGAANAWVTPSLAGFRDLHPDVRVEVMIEERNLDIARGDADVAIRFGARPTEETLIVRHLVDLEETVYAARDLVVRTGLPADYADLARYPLVGFAGGTTGPITEWYARQAPDAQIVHRANTTSGVIAAVRAGLGVGVLPCLMGDEMPGLVRLFPPIGELTTPGWLVMTDSARQQPHVRALVDHIVAFIRRAIARAQGEGQIARAA